MSQNKGWLVLGATGSKGSAGMSLREVKRLVDQAVAEGMDLDETRLCTNVRRGWKGVPQVWLVDRRVEK